ncbi:MAG: serine kinase [Verrucomicrobia bacterium]|nr:serine kinase [Verrucomicrobiota bacterium]
MNFELKSVLAAVEAEPLTNGTPTEIQGCYISDLLSDVLAHAQSDVLWLTLQTHRNVVACAATKDIGAVLITCGRTPDPQVLAEAEENGVALLSTPLTTYEAAGRLWEAGLR